MAWDQLRQSPQTSPPGLYTKAPALAAVYDWTGFYIGVNAGVGLGRDRFQHDWLGEDRIYSFYTSPQGGFGGGQIGYNWQTGSILGPIVFGVEADIQGAGLSDDRTNFVIGAVSRRATARSSTGSEPRAGGSASPMVRC